MSDKTIDSLRQAFMKDKDNTKEDCPMADLTAAYAFGDLGPAESKKAKEHLTTCRYCLDLYMDIGMAEEDAKAGMAEKVEVLQGLQDAINKSKPKTVSPFQKIGQAILDYLSSGSLLRPAATFATILLVVIVGALMMQKDTPDSPYSIQLLVQGRSQVGFRGGQPEYKEIPVEPGGELESGDYFRIQTKIDRDAYLYVVFQDSSGEIRGLDKGLITGGTDLFLPSGDKWFRLDQVTGTERIWVLASEKPIENFEKQVEALKSSGTEKIRKVFSKISIQSFIFNHE